MFFFSVRELRLAFKQVWGALAQDQEVVITKNGKPTALMISIPDGKFDETLKYIRQAKWALTSNGIRQDAARHGYIEEADTEAEVIVSHKEES